MNAEPRTDADTTNPYQAGIDRLVRGEATIPFPSDPVGALQRRIAARRMRELETLRMQRWFAEHCVECGAALVDDPRCPCCGRAREDA